MIEIRTLAAAAAALDSAAKNAPSDASSVATALPDSPSREALVAALTPPRSSSPPVVGAKLGDSVVLAQLSKPGAAVSLKVSRGDAVLVAKTLPGASVAERAAALAVQLRATSANATHFAAPIGLVVENGAAYILRPFVPGVTLAEIMAILAKEEVPPDAPTWRLAAGARGGGANVTGAKMVCRFGQHVAETLEALHARQVIHGAIKPENLVCDDTVKPTLVDAGLGHPVAPYEAPEILAAPNRSAARNALSDLYALGALMWFGLTRRQVFDSDAATAKEKPQSPLKFNFKASNEMSTITLALLEKDPSKRYASAKDLREELDRYHTNVPIQRKGPGLFSRLFGG